MDKCKKIIIEEIIKETSFVNENEGFVYPEFQAMFLKGYKSCLDHVLRVVLALDMEKLHKEYDLDDKNNKQN